MAWFPARPATESQSDMEPDEILKAFDNIRVWRLGDRRAPHKPLLILMALGNLARGEQPRAEFAQIEGKLESAKLLGLSPRPY